MSSLRGLIFNGGSFRPGQLEFEHGRIRTIQWQTSPAATEHMPYIVPGLIDLHVHGFGGFEPRSDLEGMAHALACAGTTAFQPTLFPAAPALLGDHCQALQARSAGIEFGKGARVLGIHLEGPFVNPLAAGALPREALAQPSVAALREILGPASGGGRGVRTLTVAPELSGAAPLIAELVRCGVRVSLGHSRAQAAEARAASAAGARAVTHLYNAMSPLHHRAAGLVGIALSQSTLFAELIGDLVHVGAEAIQVALAARGAEGLCLVSDALQGAGSGCEVFEARGLRHIVRDGAAYYLPNASGGEPQLAGSASSQLEMVQKLVLRGVVSLEEALLMASSTPARALGLEHELGHLVPGAFADLIVLSTHDLSLQQTYVHGRKITRPAGHDRES